MSIGVIAGLIDRPRCAPLEDRRARRAHRMSVAEHRRRVFMANSTVPNAVFIVGDNVGWGDIGCYGGWRPRRASMPSPVRGCASRTTTSRPSARSLRARRSSPTSASPRCTRRSSAIRTSGQIGRRRRLRHPRRARSPHRPRCSTSTRPTSPTTRSSCGPVTTRPDEHSRWAAPTGRGAATGSGFEGGMRAPGMVRWPGHVPTGAVTDEIVTAVDWLPTLASLIGESQQV